MNVEIVFMACVFNSYVNWGLGSTYVHTSTCTVPVHVMLTLLASLIAQCYMCETDWD